MIRSRASGTALLTLLLLGSVTLAASVGAGGLSLSETLLALGRRGSTSSVLVVWDVRMPRIALAVLVGGALGLSGAVFQALLRNPLAEPYILGVSGGGALGAVVAIVLGWASASSWGLPLAAFVGSVAAMVVVLGIAAGVGRRLDPGVLLLAGVVVGAFLSAVIMLLLTFAEIDSFRSAVFWLMGSLDRSWSEVAWMAAYFLPSAALLISMARALDLMAIGEETAHFLGIGVERTKLVAYLTTSLLVGAAVAASGVIGFVGLIVPHAIRMTFGSGHRFLLPASVLAGASFLVLTDMVARTAVAPSEIPTGVATAIVGVPIFVVILIRSRR